MQGRGRIDTRQPINWRSPLARGLSRAWLGLPGQLGPLVAEVTTGSRDLGGALTNGAFWSGSPYGPAVEFDGTNDYVSVTNQTTLPTTLTLAVRLRRTGNGGANGSFAVAKDSNAAGRSFALGINSSNQPYLEVNGAPQNSSYSGSALALGRWYWLVWTWDGSFHRFYQDAQYIAYGATSLTTSTTPLTFGRRSYSGYEGYLPGQVSEVWLWGRALADGGAALAANATGEVGAFVSQPAAYAGLFRRATPWAMLAAPTSPPPPPPAGSGFPAAVVGGGYGW